MHGYDDTESAAAIEAGAVTVDGAVVTNPNSMVAPDARVVVTRKEPPRGVAKLGFALDHFGVDARARNCLDVGASTGGFTKALLDRGAARVVAVDIGFGQLLGSLRQDPRVVVHERTNASELTPPLVGPVDLVVVDVTNVTLGAVVGQLSTNLDLQPGCELVALVKPMFELRRGELPASEDELAEAVRRATGAIAAAGWEVAGTVRSAMLGRGGAIEFFVHARRP